jgi:hypothetical protein
VSRGPQRGMSIPWPALAVCGVFGLLGLWLQMWWAAGFFLGMPALLLALDQAVRHGWIMHPDEREANRRHAQKSRRKSSKSSKSTPAPPEPQAAWAGPMPELDAAGQAEVRRMVAALTHAGLFAPQVPDAALAFPHVADGLDNGADEIALEEVLHALSDPREWFGDAVDPAGWSARFVVHNTQVEQEPDYLVQQVHDLARISQGALVVEQVEVVEGEIGADRSVPITMRLLLNGEPQEWHWLGHVKYLSTVLQGHMARALVQAETGRRLAFFYLDQGFIFACLEHGALDQLAGLPSWGHGWFDDLCVVEAGSTKA